MPNSMTFHLFNPLDHILFQGGGVSNLFSNNLGVMGSKHICPMLYPTPHLINNDWALKKLDIDYVKLVTFIELLTRVLQYYKTAGLSLLSAGLFGFVKTTGRFIMIVYGIIYVLE